MDRHYRLSFAVGDLIQLAEIARYQLRFYHNILYLSHPQHSMIANFAEDIFPLNEG